MFPEFKAKRSSVRGGGRSGAGGGDKVMGLALIELKKKLKEKIHSSISATSSGNNGKHL